MSTEAKFQLPEISTRQKVHITLGKGMLLLDRIHYTGTDNLELDDSMVLDGAATCLRRWWRPFPEHDYEVFFDTEKAELIQEALGSETREEAQRRSVDTAVAIDSILKQGVERTGLVAFYNAQDVVRRVWEATKPTEFRD